VISSPDVRIKQRIPNFDILTYFRCISDFPEVISSVPLGTVSRLMPPLMGKCDFFE